MVEGHWVMSHEWIPIEESPFLYCVGMANFKLPALVSGFLCRQTTLWLYGIMFALAVTKNMIQTNTGALKPPNPYMVTKVQGPSVPGILMSKFTRCSYPFLLIYINSSISQRKRRHPQPIIPHSKNVLQTPYVISQPPNPGS